MIHDIKVAQTVRVWPRPGLRVLVDPRIPGRFLPDEGAEVAWSSWWHRRALDGSVLIGASAPQPTPSISAGNTQQPTKPDAKGDQR